MSNLFLSEQDCIKGLEDLGKLLTTEIQSDNPDQVSAHLSKLAGYKAYADQIQASCLYLKLGNPKNTEYRAMEKLSERYNNSYSKILMACSSLLAKLREEIRISKYQI